MTNRSLFLAVSVGFSSACFSFPCYMALVKDSCWTNYDVTMKVYDAAQSKLMTTILVPAGKSWTRAHFDCQPKETFMLEASYSPAFWQSDEGKIYSGKRYWSMPEKIGDSVAWSMNICYAAEFAGVPLPPDATGNCKCDMSTIPDVKAK